MQATYLLKNSDILLKLKYIWKDQQQISYES